MSPTGTPSAQAIWQQVETLENSPLFAGSERLLAFLRFVIAETLKGEAGSLKEAVIGNAVYDRDPPYDPRLDSTVRVEARRLRRKLKEHYAGPGALDPVQIMLAPRGYTPVFTLTALPATPTDGESLFRHGAGAAIAVMPLRALSHDPEDEIFADGLTDELIYTLGQMQGLRVAARTAVFQYKDRFYQIPDLARDLAVDAVLQGTVRRDGDRVRVTVEASDTQGFVVWSDRFDAPRQEVLSLQERIAATILSRARIDSSKMRARQIAPGPEALSAMAQIYQARQALDRQTPKALGAALALFQEITRAMPDYARGYSGIADCYCDLFRLGLVDRATALREAEKATQQALTIDPKSIEAYAARATIAAWLNWDPDQAEALFQQALALGENARVARIYGTFLTYCGRHDEARRLQTAARISEPFSVQQDIAESVSHYQARRYDALHAEALTTPEPPVEVLFFTALGRVFQGEAALAAPVLPKLAQLSREYPDFREADAELKAWAGAPEAARRRLTEARGATSWFGWACLAAAANAPTEALFALSQAVTRRDLSVVWIGTDARFDALRALNGFQDLIGSIKGNAED